MDVMLCSGLPLSVRYNKTETAYATASSYTADVTAYLGPDNTALSSLTGVCSSTASVSATSTASGTSWYYSPVYSSTSTDGAVLAQVFTQGPDPSPDTHDWTHCIISVDMSEWDEFQMSAYITSVTIKESGDHAGEWSPFPYSNVLFRAMTESSELSGTFPLNGVVSSYGQIPDYTHSWSSTAQPFWSASARIRYGTGWHRQTMTSNSGSFWSTASGTVIDHGGGKSSVIYTSTDLVDYYISIFTMSQWDRETLYSASGDQPFGPYPWQLPTSYINSGLSAMEFGTGIGNVTATEYGSMVGFSSDWQPVSAIAGSSHEASACFGFFGGQALMMNASGVYPPWNFSVMSSLWEEGKLSSMPERCAMSGVVQFRKRVGPGVETSVATAIFPYRTTAITSTSVPHEDLVASAVGG